MRRTSYLILLLGAILLLGMDLTPTSAQANSAYEVVAAVNDFRTANGLPPLRVDPILMSIAQSHSDYQASIRTVTHRGPGGSRPKDRAYAAGFGGGATIFLSENIAGGINLTINQAIYQYWQDELHLRTMLNPDSLFIGAGVGTVDDYVYYTVDVGYYSGAPDPGSTTTPAPGKPTATGVAYDPFVVSTPREDGAIIHIIGYGQSLIGIANSYGVELNELLALNGLSLDSIIYPGDEIIIRPGFTPTTTPSPTATQRTRIPTATAKRATATPRDTSTPNPSVSPTPTEAPPSTGNGRGQLVTGVVIMALLVFLAVVISGFLPGQGREETAQ